MTVPIWVWAVVILVILIFVALYLYAIVRGYRRFQQMDKDFNEARERVRRSLRQGARRT